MIQQSFLQDVEISQIALQRIFDFLANLILID